MNQSVPTQSISALKPKIMDENYDAEHNFSRVSARDAQAFGSARPAFPSSDVTSADFSAWVEFMKSKGVKRVLSLLGDDEKVQFYPNFDIDDAMVEAFGREQYTRTSVYVAGSRQIMSDALAAAKQSGDTIVIHCSGGEGRAALGMSLWLVDTYGLAPQDACREIDEQTQKCTGVVRRTSPEKLTYLITNGTMVGFKKSQS